MEEKLDSKVMKLEKEIFDISNNINKFKNKNHITMLNIMEKIKSFSNELKLKNDKPKLNVRSSYQNKKKTLIKTYQSLSNEKLLPNNPTNQNTKYESKTNNKNSMVFKKNNTNLYNNNKKNNGTINIYSNKNFLNRKKNELTNMSYKQERQSIHLDRNDTNNINECRNSCNCHVNKCFSFNFDYLIKKIEPESEEIKIRTNSENTKLNNNFKNNLFNTGSTDDFKFPKIIKNESKINKNKHLQKVKSFNYNRKVISKKIIKNIKLFNQNTIVKPIRNLKKDHYNSNITEYYKNINNQEKYIKKKNSKIANKKKLKNYSSSRNNNIYKLYKKNVVNGNITHQPNYISRNYIYTKINDNTYDNRANNTNTMTINEKDNICSTFNPYDNKINEEQSGELIKDTKKSVNTFREKIPLNKNPISLNNKKNNLNRNKYHYHFQNKLVKYIDNNSYHDNSSTKNKKNRSYDINDDINNNKNRLSSNSNYNKDFIDIITNKNNINYKYDYESIYNNNINQKNDKSNDNEVYKYTIVNEKKYNSLLAKLKSKNIDECINKIDMFIKYEEFINKINLLYNNFNIYNKHKKKDLQEIFSWIQLNIEENKKYKTDLKKSEHYYGRINEEYTIDTFDNSNNNLIQSTNRNKINRILDYGTEKTKYEYNLNNENIYRHNKENMSLNSIYNSYDNSSFRNKQNYSLISFTHLKNPDETSKNNS